MKRLLSMILPLLVGIGCDGGQETRPVTDADALIDVEVVDSARPDFGSDASPQDAGLRPDTSMMACEPPLELSASSSAVRSFDIIRLIPTGGTGAWTFHLVENNSGGLINRETGVYLAGENSGVIDVVELRDEACEGAARLEINVVTELEVSPSRPEVLPGESFQFETSGGSGSVEFRLVNGSDSSLTASGFFEAGSKLGQQTIEVRDLGTEQVVVLSVSVNENQGIRAVYANLYLTHGGSYKPDIRGGSGVYELAVDGANVTVDDGRLVPMNAGRSEVLVRDRFLNRTTSFSAVVPAEMTVSLEPTSDGTNSAIIRMASDLNGDGHRDVIMGHSEADVRAGNGGAVYVFLSNSSGQISGQPVQILSGENRDDQFGSALEVGDVTGDGLDDLVVGVRQADLAGVNSGGVFVFAGTGTPEQPFSEVPTQTLTGVNAFDFFGSALSLCDFNGDSLLDIAVGASFYEDRRAQPIANTQGGIFVYAGTTGGVDISPDILVGQTLEQGNFVNSADLRVGENRDSLASGDFDGDGLCDLAVGTIRYQHEGGNLTGLVQLYKGQAGAGLARGGLSVYPSLAITEMRTSFEGRTQASGQLGRVVKMGDVNGDGREDLLISQHAGDVGGQDAGSSYLFLGTVLPDQTSMAIGVADADWAFHGSNYDNHSYSMVIDDLDQDGIKDVLSASIYEDLPNRGNTGAILAFLGRASALPNIEPDVIFEGITADSRIGEHFGIKSDEDEDGLRDLVVYANRSHTGPLHVGALQVMTSAPVESEEERSVQELSTVRVPSAQRFGNGVDYIGDVDGDGFEDVLVTAPFSTHQEAEIRSGTAWLFFGTVDGFEAIPKQLPTFPGHSAHDLLWSVSRAGDFDGDGIDDFAILLRSDEQPTSFNADVYAKPENCVERLGDSGGVFIYRGGERAAIGIQPSYVYWGHQRSVSPETIAFPGDVNGDGYDDLLLGSIRWDQGANDVGAFDVIGGRSMSNVGVMEVICFPLLRHIGEEGGGQLGISATTLGDVNGDGCDDFAVGAQGEAGGGPTRQGIVWLFQGAGGVNCHNDFRVARLQTGESQGRFGSALAAGDLDGDGRTELVIGAFNRVLNGGATGGAWIVMGEKLQSVVFRPLVEAFQQAPILVRDELEAVSLEGKNIGSQFGLSVAVSGAYVAVGSPSGTMEEATPVGAVYIYEKNEVTTSFDEVALVVGEVERPGGRTGERLAGARSPQGRFLVGAPTGNGTGLDNGSAYDVIMPSRP